MAVTVSCNGYRHDFIIILNEVFATLQISEPAVSAGLKLLSPLLFGQNYVNVARKGVHFLGADH